MNMDIKEAQSHIVELFAQCDDIPKGANIELRNDTPDVTIVLHCDWNLAEPKPSAKTTSREITLQLDSSATQLYLNANDVALPTLDKRLRIIVRNRLKNGYRETDSQDGSFIIRIGKNDLK